MLGNELALYIPHSSDKTEKNTKTSTALSLLYIPHSSDKTSKQGTCLGGCLRFTSHIVQIKPSQGVKTT